MTTFDTSIPDLGIDDGLGPREYTPMEIPDPRPPKPLRAAAVDHAIRKQRAATPPAVADARTTKRMSIEEMNAADPADLKARFYSAPYDDRSGFTRFLDLVDLPRNVIGNLLAGTIAPGLRDKQVEAGETGTFGMARVRFSDILDHLGVKNHVINGVVGFVGDVALDPLTYIGGAGLGVKLISKGGRVVEGTAEMRRAINAAATVAARGGTVAGELGDYLKATDLAGTIAKNAGKSPKELEAAIRAAHLYGNESGMAKKVVTGAFGLDFKNTNSPLANLAHTVLTEAEALANPALAAQVKAAKAVVARYGRASAPGVGVARDAAGRLGMASYGAGEAQAKGGSYLAHIPFTSYGLFVPGFTDPAARSMVTRAIATSGYANELDGEAGKFKGFADRATVLRQEGEQLVAGANAASANPATEAAHTALLKDIADRSDTLAAELKSAIDTRKASPVDSVADVLYRRQQEDIAFENARLLQNQMNIAGVDLQKRKELLETIGHVAGEPIDPSIATDPAHIKLLSMTDSELASMEGLVKNFHAEMQSRSSLAHALKGSVAETGKSPNTMLAKVAASMMGLDAETHGNSYFTPLRDTILRMFGSEGVAAMYGVGAIDAVEQAARRHLGIGNKSGMANWVRDKLQKSAPVAMRQAEEHWKQTIRAPIVQAAKDAGIGDAALPEFVTMAERVATSLAFAADHAFDVRELVLYDKFRKMGGNALFPMLQALANQSKDALIGIGKRDIAAGTLTSLKEGYMPGVLSAEGMAARRARDIARAKELNVPVEGLEKAELVAFDQPQSMQRAAFQYLDGETVKDAVLYRHEYKYYKGLTDDVLESALAQPHTREAALRDSALRDAARAWDALPASEKIGAAAFKDVSPWVKNAELQEHMGMMALGSPGRGYFEESLPEIMMNRAGASEMQYANKMYEAVHAGEVVLVPKVEYDLANRSTDPVRRVRMADGTEGIVSELDAQKGRFVLTINGNRYRQLADPGAAMEAFNSWGAGIVDPSQMMAVYPEKLAMLKDKTVATLSKPGDLLKVLDETLGIWKSFTLTNPSWTINDFAGNTIQLLNMGFSPVTIIKALNRARQIAFASTPEAIKKLGKIAVGGAEETVEHWRNETSTVRRGMIHGVSAAEAFENGSVKLAEMPVWSTAMFTDPINHVKKVAKDMNARAATASTVAMQNAKFAKVPFAKQMAKAKGLAYDQAFIRTVVAPWFALNGHVNDFMRTVGWIAARESGMDSAAATQHVLEHMFDFEDMTNFEKNVMRRAIPFYSWLKSSSVYGLSQMLENPKYLAIAPRVKEALEHTLYGEGSVPDHMRPNWMRDQLALQLGDDPTTRFALSVATILPQEGAYKIGSAAAAPFTGSEGLKELLQYVGFGFHPFVRAITDLSQGQEGFSGRSISFSPDQGDLTAKEYMLNMVGPLRNFGVGNIRGSPISAAFEKSTAGGIGRLLEGGRVQPFDAERLDQNILREFKTTEDQIRKRIRVAVRSGNKSAERAGRARLMSLYAKMRKKGAGKAVPRWANTQLDTILGVQ